MCLHTRVAPGNLYRHTCQKRLRARDQPTNPPPVVFFYFFLIFLFLDSLIKNKMLLKIIGRSSPYSCYAVIRSVGRSVGRVRLRACPAVLAHREPWHHMDAEPPPAATNATGEQLPGQAAGTSPAPEHALVNDRHWSNVARGATFTVELKDTTQPPISGYTGKGATARLRRHPTTGLSESISPGWSFKAVGSSDSPFHINRSAVASGVFYPADKAKQRGLGFKPAPRPVPPPAAAVPAPAPAASPADGAAASPSPAVPRASDDPMEEVDYRAMLGVVADAGSVSKVRALRDVLTRVKDDAACGSAHFVRARLGQIWKGKAKDSMWSVRDPSRSRSALA